MLVKKHTKPITSKGCKRCVFPQNYKQFYINIIELIINLNEHNMFPYFLLFKSIDIKTY